MNPLALVLFFLIVLHEVLNITFRNCKDFLENYQNSEQYQIEIVEKKKNVKKISPTESLFVIHYSLCLRLVVE